jgi:NifU-like protein involved in Fe-S cluster formation
VSNVADPYGEVVRRLFRTPAHAGELEGGRHVQCESQGVIIELSLVVEGPTIAKLRFRAYGCPHLIAAAEAFCEAYEGRPVADLAAFTAVELCERLPVPARKTGRILVLEDAVRSLAT